MGSSGRGATRAAKLATPGPGVKAGCDEVGRNARRFKLERARSTSTLRRTVNQTDSPDRYRGRHGFVATVLLAICVFAARGSFAQAGPSPADGVAQVIAATDGGGLVAGFGFGADFDFDGGHISGDLERLRRAGAEESGEHAAGGRQNEAMKE